MHLKVFSISGSSAVVSLSYAFFVFAAIGHAQNPTLERFRERRDQAVKAAEEREKTGTSEAAAARSTVKSPVMNVDAQMVLTRSEFENFAAARPNAVAKVKDGETLWMYVKFKGKLGDHVVAAEKAEDGTPRHQLFVEIGPQGDITALNRFVLLFRDEDLDLTELKFNLAPGLRGDNASIPIFLERASSTRPGVWQNEIRISNTNLEPRPLTMNLANAPLSLDLTNGAENYKRMYNGYDSAQMFGASMRSARPLRGRFESLRIRDLIKLALAAKEIRGTNLYFSSDDWMESYTVADTKKRSRYVLAVFAYTNGDGCFFGTARVEETFDGNSRSFGDTRIWVGDARPITCTEIDQP